MTSLLFPRAFVQFERPVGSHSDPLTPAPAVLDAVYLALYMRYQRHRVALQLIDDRAPGKAALPSAEEEETASVEPSPLPPLKLPSSGLYQILVTHVRILY